MDDRARLSQRLVEPPPPRDDVAVASQFRLLALPPDVVALLVVFFTGVDLLQVSHVHRDLYGGLLAHDSEAWQRLAPMATPLHALHMRAPPPSRPQAPLFRFPRPEPPTTAKQRYFARRSVRFGGGGRPTGRGGAITTPSVQDIARNGSFSLDLTFALVPTVAPNVTRAGGILLGAQSVSATVDRHANQHQQVVHVDPEGNLFCSVMRHKPIAAERLAVERWYHVALVFEITGPASATQRVHLDGELVHTTQGWLHDEWDHLSYAQLGTGCITGGALGPSACGWYAFNGLVDECRFWNGGLDADEVRLLANGAIDATQTCAECTWSMRANAGQAAVGNVSLAHSTAPVERVALAVVPTRALSSSALPTVSHRHRP